ncbi:MAG TPA: GntR family transcriptional regulator [Halieaceae bacterium]|uniref:GntR family transcriptional regulator n=1 Tax=Haliea TaxID=475794 RepID=UPI000C3B86D4|nr:GntR family transcriptional regulator [Haliea sp.]HAN67500.1 GntR family transcriptional regulator [Halieaceae bacterium]MBP70084.1 GntR family transcriptional regulator [Haliea sp.]HBM83916.1 GntR family transcriptional regulator [Halieaceae bacterium]HBQ39832.1 GntR family transcriptional regulator [Halieaceae bacterium]
MQWHDEQPIYRQLRDLVVERILDGSFVEGEAVPSVRQVASDYRINHLTVGKAYQELVETGLLEKRRGLGMYVTVGARAALTADEQARFFARELPAFVERVRNLGLDIQQVATRLLQEGEGK